MLAEVYPELRAIARRIMAGNALGRLFQPTELAHEATIKLIRANLSAVNDSGHLLAIAARTMRQLLIDEARKGLSAKRQPAGLPTAWPGEEARAPIDLHSLDAALAALATLSPVRARIVELRFMLGMTVEETAAVTGVPERTVKRHWQAARAWLLAHLKDEDANIGS